MVIVYTGVGKGKTTAALGLALRAIGQGFKVLIIQFLKSSRAYGEIKAAQRLAPDLKIIQTGRDCVFGEKDPRRYDCPECDFLCHIDPASPSEGHRTAAGEGLRLAQKEIKSNRYQMVILDEINYAIAYGLVSLESVLSLIKEKPASLHLVLTGRDAKEEIIKEADLVTETLDIKHPFQKGIKSVRGVDL